MKALILAILLLSSYSGFSQFRVKRSLLHTLANYFSGERPTQKRASFLLPGDPTQGEISQKLTSPMLLASAGGTQSGGELYWMSTVTSQSYNRGKMGTYYYWDVQGNLRESRMFFDIAGKNKRGLKLVFPRK